jgi:hypothetical protein
MPFTSCTPGSESENRQRLSHHRLAVQEFLWMPHLGASGLVCVLLFVCRIPAFGATVPEDVRRALEANAAATSRLHVEWTRSRTSQLSVEEFVRKVGQTDRALFEPNEVIYVRSGDKFYHHDQYYTQVGEDLKLQRGHTAFDGSKLRMGSDSLGRSNAFRVDSPEHFRQSRPLESYVFYTAYFDAVGIHLGNRVSDLFSPPQSVPLMLLKKGAQLQEMTHEVFEGHDCLVLVERAENGLHRFWLAPKMGYAVVRIQELDSKEQLLEETVNSSFEELADPTLWLPKESLVTHYTWYTAPNAVFKEALLTTRFSVNNLTRADVDQFQFIIDTTKGGSQVGDSTIAGVKDKDGYVQFGIPASERDLNQHAGQARLRFSWLIAANAAVFVILAAVWIYRRRRSRPQ